MDIFNMDIDKELGILQDQTNKLKEGQKKIDALQQEAEVKTINLVTCGECGFAFAHMTGVDKLRCPKCEFNSDKCNFPDIYLEEQNEFLLVN